MYYLYAVSVVPENDASFFTGSYPRPSISETAIFLLHRRRLAAKESNSFHLFPLREIISLKSDEPAAPFRFGIIFRSEEDAMYEFLIGLDPDLSTDVIRHFRELWMHGVVEPERDSNENENPWVFEFRRKPCGKPLETYRRDAGHIRAIQRVLDILLGVRPFVQRDLFELHRILMAKVGAHPLEPVGAWKVEPNGTFMHVGKDQVYYQYADPADVPFLMREWLAILNRDMGATHCMNDAARNFARLHLTFVWVHPFYNGNGRLARLLSNAPVLRAGFPPILIPRRDRPNYFRLLDEFKIKKGRADRNTDLDLRDECLGGFCEFCASCWRKSLDLVAKARQVQEGRNRSRRESASGPSKD